MSLRLLLQKDLAREWRSKESFLTGVVLVGLFFVLFLFVGETGDAIATLALWTPILYATAAMTGRGLAGENDRGTLEWILSAPVPRALHGWSRTITDLTVATVLVALATLLASQAFGLQVTGSLLLVLALATLGLTVGGAMAAGIAAQARLREVLLPVLLIPVAAPLLQSGVEATKLALAGASIQTPLMLMAGYDLIVLGLAWLLWPHILGAD